MGLDTCRASPQVVAEDPASEVLITSRVADQNPNTIPASRLMQRWRWINSWITISRGDALLGDSTGASGALCVS